jgi:polyphosphate glucokinase
VKAGPDAVTTLAVDCGGGGIKGSVLDSAGTMLHKPVRVPTPYPLPPDRFLETLRALATRLPAADRVTVGLPGMIRHGVVVRTPHYVTTRGPRSRIDPGLVELWHGFHAEAAVAAAFDRPALVLNDAEVHGAGVVAGTGLELVLTFGTGLGCALFDGGRIAPHLELSHAPVRSGLTYDAYVGEHERRRLGSTSWSRRVRRVVEGLEPVFAWDRVYLGGGNSRNITAEVLAALQRLQSPLEPPVPPDADLGEQDPGRVVVVPNTAGIAGGVRAWSLAR